MWNYWYHAKFYSLPVTEILRAIKAYKTVMEQYANCPLMIETNRVLIIQHSGGEDDHVKSIHGIFMVLSIDSDYSEIQLIGNRNSGELLDIYWDQITEQINIYWMIKTKNQRDEDREIVDRLVSERARINKKRGKAKLEKNLTDKEFEVMELLQKKYTIDQICEKLKIAKTTLRTHRSNVRNKLGASNNYDCLIILELWGWLPKSTFVD